MTGALARLDATNINEAIHYLNTETDEGLKQTPVTPQVDHGLTQHWDLTRPVTEANDGMVREALAKAKIAVV